VKPDARIFPVRDNSSRRFRYDRVTFPHRIRSIVGATLACALLTAPVAGLQPVPVVERVLARKDPPPDQYRALRRLEARSEHFRAAGWMEAWTDVDPVGGFRYEIVGEGGSGYVRSHVLRAALDGERNLWLSSAPQRAALTMDNYAFEENGPSADGLEAVGVKARRKDVLLVDGSIFVKADDGDLVRIEGRLSKTPSFWTRRVEVIRRYQRINGIRVPVAIESVAQVLIAGRSTFKMTYEYETINGDRVGDPRPGRY
jgi:hypothetical protein